MNAQANSKVQARHLSRQAFLYVRQSTLRQVFENTESTQRQYALQQRAIALGWRPEQIVVIDSDLGRSGASATDREGFQRLVTEVGLGHAGIVMGLEVSRLARNSTDWHRLLEICALAETDDFDAAVASVAAQVPLLVVTRGAQGAIALSNGDRTEVGAEPIDTVVDTTGAGDLFAAGFLTGYTQGRDLKACATMGTIAAAEVIEHYGARPEADLKARVKAVLG